MMKAFAGWVLAGRLNALTLTSGFAVLGVVFPPLLLISLASLALVGLRMGAQQGLLIAAGSAGLVFILSLADSRGGGAGATVFLALCLLTWLMSQVYRQYASAACMINAVGAIGALSVIAAYLILGEPAVYWLGLLEQYLRPQLLQTQFFQSEAELNDWLNNFSRVMTGGITGLVCLWVIVSLLLARWWQAILFNPGGFQKEFHGLRLGRLTAWTMLTLLAMSLVGEFSLTLDLATVVWLLFLFQGLAVVHHLVLQLGANAGWLIAIYFLLAIKPHYVTPVLSGLGLIDTWFDFRLRIRGRHAAKDEEDSGKDS